MTSTSLTPEESRTLVLQLLTSAARAHGIHEEQHLAGVYDEEWPSWYTAHIVAALDGAGYTIHRSRS